MLTNIYKSLEKFSSKILVKHYNEAARTLGANVTSVL